MSNHSKTPDPKTRARDIASLREAGRLLDLWTLELDEAIAALDKHLLQQRRARLLYKSNYLEFRLKNERIKNTYHKLKANRF